VCAVLSSEGPQPLAEVWNEAGWLSFYENRRNKTSEVYPSEWFFLKDLLVEGMSVLDIGCALGGLASILSEHLGKFSYTGVDISEEMIREANAKHPSHHFHLIQEADLSVLGDSTYDLVAILGVLHLSRKWREMVGAGWVHTRKSLLMDLRETSGPTIEQQEISYYRVGQLLGNHSKATLPYNVINAGDALATLLDRCEGALNVQHYGYLAPASVAAFTPAKNVLMNTYRIDRR
jgi:hypothetical protein